MDAPAGFILEICLRSEWIDLGESQPHSTDAEITLTRALNNAVIVRQATVNGEQSFIEWLSVTFENLHTPRMLAAHALTMSTTSNVLLRA